MALPHTLLFVEDSSDDEILTLRGIRTSGVPCTVQVIRHGREALDALLSSESPCPDLIVLDFHLPGRSGLEILRELRRHEKTRRVPIVMLSATESDDDVSRAWTRAPAASFKSRWIPRPTSTGSAVSSGTGRPSTTVPSVGRAPSRFSALP